MDSASSLSSVPVKWTVVGPRTSHASRARWPGSTLITRISEMITWCDGGSFIYLTIECICKHSIWTFQILMGSIVLYARPRERLAALS